MDSKSPQPTFREALLENRILKPEVCASLSPPARRPTQFPGAEQASCYKRQPFANACESYNIQMLDRRMAASEDRLLAARIPAARHNSIRNRRKSKSSQPW